MPVNKEISEFAETMTSMFNSKAEEHSSSNFYRRMTKEELMGEIHRIDNHIQYEDNVIVKAMAIELALISMTLWQKL